MANLEFIGTADERRRQAELMIAQMHRDLYGNGTPGIIPRLEKFITEHDTQEAMRDKQHTENQEKLAASQGKMNIIIGLLLILIALIGAAPALKAMFKSSADFLPDVFQVSHRMQAQAIESAHLPNVR